jgi:membrane-associated phospholipid phosphatase
MKGIFTPRFFIVALAAVIAGHLLDGFAFEFLRYREVNSQDWGRLLRVMGFFPTWMLAAAALALHDRFAALRWRRAGLLFFSAGLSGLAGEILKLLIRRLRPGETGEYAFRAFSDDPFSSGGLGMPSSHAVVAFGAAAMLSRLFPRAWPVWWLLGAGCGLTRILHGRHFLSDVVVSAIVGWAVAALLWSRWPAPKEVYAEQRAQSG